MIISFYTEDILSKDQSVIDRLGCTLYEECEPLPLDHWIRQPPTKSNRLEQIKNPDHRCGPRANDRCTGSLGGCAVLKVQALQILIDQNQIYFLFYKPDFLSYSSLHAKVFRGFSKLDPTCLEMSVCFLTTRTPLLLWFTLLSFPESFWLVLCRVTYVSFQL